MYIQHTKILPYFISPFLIKLHCLPVRHRIPYKTLLLAHKAIHHDSPDYLASLLKLKLPTSTTTFLLQLPPKHNLHSTNTRAWAISVPYSWNTLPESIRTTPSTPNFKKLLKTHLFNMNSYCLNINFKYIWKADCFISTVRSLKTEKCKNVMYTKSVKLLPLNYLVDTKLSTK